MKIHSYYIKKLKKLLGQRDRQMETPTIDDEKTWIEDQINDCEWLIDFYKYKCDPTAPGHTYHSIKQNRLWLRAELNRLDTLKTDLKKILENN